MVGHTVSLIASRESSDHSNMIEPSFDTINQRVESETQIKLLMYQVKMEKQTGNKKKRS